MDWQLVASYFTVKSTGIFFAVCIIVISLLRIDRKEKTNFYNYTFLLIFEPHCIEIIHVLLIYVKPVSLQLSGSVFSPM